MASLPPGELGMASDGGHRNASGRQHGRYGSKLQNAKLTRNLPSGEGVGQCSPGSFATADAMAEALLLKAFLNFIGIGRYWEFLKIDAGTVL